ncbi:hypothetical protein K445DRAFT_100445 [Daldinia sp. EC12]|nr:hypothetical protein K445DRAFT_100445 [Daldinia sp. EC12]
MYARDLGTTRLSALSLYDRRIAAVYCITIFFLGRTSPIIGQFVDDESAISLSELSCEYLAVGGRCLLSCTYM